MITGIFGPFKNLDDVNNYWYQAKEKELEDNIEDIKKKIEDTEICSDEDKKIYEQDLKNFIDELENLKNFVDDYTRCVERYKFDKKILQQIQDDWVEYNSSLYADYCHIQSWMLQGTIPQIDELKSRRNEMKSEKIKREEIEKRIRDLLLK